MKQPLPLPFYATVAEQNRFKTQCEGYSGNEILIQDGCKLIPFQIQGNVFSSIYTKTDMEITLINANTGATTLLFGGATALIPATDIRITEDANSNSYITYYGLTDIEDGGICVFDTCNYYLSVIDTSIGNLFTWYSEVFRVAKDSETFVKIAYDNSTDFPERVLYQEIGGQSYSNILYLDVDIKAPEYPVTEDGNENGDKQFIPSFIKWEKRYSFTSYFPEYLVDAITALPLHNDIYLTFKNGDVYKIKDISVEVDWQDLGDVDSVSDCFASLTMTFAIDSIVVTSCDDDMTITEPPP